jgi:hypothetical protein
LAATLSMARLHAAGRSPSAFDGTMAVTSGASPAALEPWAQPRPNLPAAPTLRFFLGRHPYKPATFYSPPEVRVDGLRARCRASDAYAVGALLWAMMTGAGAATADPALLAALCGEMEAGSPTAAPASAPPPPDLAGTVATMNGGLTSTTSAPAAFGAGQSATSVGPVAMGVESLWGAYVASSARTGAPLGSPTSSPAEAEATARAWRSACAFVRDCCATDPTKRKQLSALRKHPFLTGV